HPGLDQRDRVAGLGETRPDRTAAGARADHDVVDLEALSTIGPRRQAKWIDDRRQTRSEQTSSESPATHATARTRPGRLHVLPHQRRARPRPVASHTLCRIDPTSPDY